MNKHTLIKYFGIAIIVVAFVFVEISLIEAQVRTQGPPPGKGKPPKINCDSNGICENGEYDYGTDWESQPCDDCKPKSYENLSIDHTGLQIVTKFEKQVFLYKHDSFDEYGSIYYNSWTSGEQDVYTHPRPTSIGDVDSDGNKEIVSIVNYIVRQETSGKGRNKTTITYWRHEIFIYEDDSDGSPAGVIQIPGEESPGQVKDAIIANIDLDPRNELVLLKGKHIEIFEILPEGNGYSLVAKHTGIFPEYEYITFTIDAGDTDNDGNDEIILAMFGFNAPIIWDFNNSGSWEEHIAEPIPSEYLPNEIDFMGIDVARARDVDNDEFNEIIAGGNNNRLMIWKYNDNSNNGYDYEFVWASEDLGGFTQGVDAGDLDGFGDIEIAVAASFYNDTLYIFKYTGENKYQIVNSIARDGADVGLSVADFDGDGKDEIVSSTQGITVYELDDFDQLVKTYNSVFGGFLKIN
ncbi:MAG: VCBS repeat-containing protein [Candidatus Aminicenantaceae bacterium]